MKIIALLLVSSLVFAFLGGDVLAKNVANKKMPPCDQSKVRYLRDQVALATSHQNRSVSQQLYLVHNTSKAGLWINHPVQHPSASAGWSTQLFPNHWSALALNTPNFLLECVELKPGAEQYIPCKKVLAVCRVKDAAFKKQNLGRYWVGENQSFSGIIQSIKRRGISLEAYA